MPHDFKRFPELMTSQLTEFYFDSPHRQIFEDFEAVVTQVHDGDTLKVKWGERDFEFPIRLANIASAELDESGGERAREWLADKVLGEEVHISINPNNRVGKFGRLIGEVIHGGMNINELAIQEHMAIEFDQRGETLLPNFAEGLNEFTI